MLHGLVLDEKNLVKELLEQNVDKKVINNFFEYKILGIPVKGWFVTTLIVSIYYRIK